MWIRAGGGDGRDFVLLPSRCSLIPDRSCQKILEDSGLYRRHALEEGSQSLIQARSRMKFIGRRGAKVVQRGNLTWEVRSFASAYLKHEYWKDVNPPVFDLALINYAPECFSGHETLNSTLLRENILTLLPPNIWGDLPY